MVSSRTVLVPVNPYIVRLYRKVIFVKYVVQYCASQWKVVLGWRLELQLTDSILKKTGAVLIDKSWIEFRMVLVMVGNVRVDSMWILEQGNARRSRSRMSWTHLEQPAQGLAEKVGPQ